MNKRFLKLLREHYFDLPQWAEVRHRENLAYDYVLSGHRSELNHKYKDHFYRSGAYKRLSFSQYCDLNFKKAVEWMWDYCIYLGPYKGYDLGVYVAPSGEVSHAIVYGDEPGNYISGEIELFNRGDLQEENIRRYRRKYETE